MIEIDDVFGTEDYVWFRDGVELLQQLAFVLQAFDNGLDDEIDAAEIIDGRRGVQPAGRGVLVGGGELALFDELREALVDRLSCAIDGTRRGVVEFHCETGLREDLRDPVTHRACTDDADRLNRCQEGLPLLLDQDLAEK